MGYAEYITKEGTLKYHGTPKAAAAFFRQILKNGSQSSNAGTPKTERSKPEDGGKNGLDAGKVKEYILQRDAYEHSLSGIQKTFLGQVYLSTGSDKSTYTNQANLVSRVRKRIEKIHGVKFEMKTGYFENRQVKVFRAQKIKVGPPAQDENPVMVRTEAPEADSGQERKSAPVWS